MSKGAPVGGRVHWLLWCLPKAFKKAYRLRYDYEYHNYHFARYYERAHSPVDEFIVIRTSKHCFRCMYFNYETSYFEYFSEPTPKAAAEHLEAFYEKILRSEARRVQR